ncbi:MULTISPECIES: hypothetical protein [unclassified Novosphingobium]|uniref:hypothetical protein n=1 Tax=unclassified Novosphingobium TaxID=2644732 RepID=UPI00086944DE|nr:MULTISPECIES: hypothetical protein [unclassified Novosphingobium]MDR6707484.1 hypothetical protein [Novosphingobium sp. 1748]ODU83403.1 MAG: hypothetical protein ABT10_07380 [Novosphingobium sp. SCN 63-17]OJX96327.1 MAG: hypothetical protein BGP00_17245 [Novosphingobium sp. 63-713]
MINKNTNRRRFQVARFFVHGSTLALIAAIPTHALAQCSPDPTQANTAVTCSGTDSDGITITTSSSPLTVNSGASVNNSGASAITVSVPASASSYFRAANITVNGSVSATGAAGISVLSRPAGSVGVDYYGMSGIITVGAGASIGGTYGIALEQVSGYPYGSVYVSLDNAGTISGSGGVALLAGSGYASYFTGITNRASGTIGAIQGSVTSVTNDGTIAGGGLSAIYNSYNLYSNITNTGTIRSSSASGTIANFSGTISNSGTITNTGTGSAINSLYVWLTNQAGGSITGSGSSVVSSNLTSTPSNAINLTNSGSIINTGTGMTLYGGQIIVTNNAGATIGTGAGGTAIYAGTSLNLTNAGTINGNVTAGFLPAYSYNLGNTIDSTAGTINGNLTLGNGNDTLIATLRNGSLYTGITGTIDGGGGTNTVSLQTNSDVTLSAALTLPTGFSSVGFVPASGTTLTLANGFANSGAINFTGSGTLDNQTSLSGTGTIFTGANYGLGGTFRNSGTITSSNAGGSAAVTLSGFVSLNNTGTISASGNAVSATSGTITNSGTITAGGTAVTSNSNITNSGTISGASIGVASGGGTLVNTGTIQSSGTAFQTSSYSTLDNRAGGVVTGGLAAVGGIGYGFNNRVINAGTINGNVNLASTGYASGNLYYAVTGGVLNGNLTIGQGDTLITDLVNTGRGAFAGINGTVSASNSSLIYNVNANASATPGPPSGFSSLGYQLSNNATLSLTGQSALTSPLTLAGIGSVNLNGSLSSSSGPLIYTTSVQAPSGGGGNPASTALAITNNGSLTVARAGSSIFTPVVMAMGSGSSLVNNGSIVVTNTAGNAVSGASAISLYGPLVNTGTISIAGAQGISIGSTWNTANTHPDTTLFNSGQITADGAAIIQYGKVDITNSGSITSRTTTAIAQYSGFNSTITNLAGATISGAATAIQMAGGMVSNAGTINGDINFGYSSGTYVANGGMLNGNLAFGYGDNMLIETGQGYGVTGTISTTGGTISLGHQRSGTTTVALGGALPANFMQEFAIAAGAASRITLTGPSSYTGTIYVGGDGTIINQLASSGSIYSLNYTSYLNTELAGLVNRANVGSIYVNAGLFDNSATVGSVRLSGNAVTLWTGIGLNFSNSGTILNAGSNPAVALYGSSPNANSTIANSGTINGGMIVSLIGGAGTTASITNSGTITGYTQSYYTYSPTPPYYAVLTINYAINASITGSQNLSLNNSGTITGDVVLTGAPVVLTNTGTMTGRIFTGTGNDAFAFGGAFTGALDGGAGTNTLAITGGNQSFSSISNIAALTQSGGFATVSGTAALGSIGLTGGRLVGLAGSVINANSIAVGSGATFGSAGTVNGNISVSGILSPGASPGTMTVNGNVTLNSGSTSLFEIAPTAQDKLIVNGKLVIASGSTLQIAATTPIKVGSTLNLISASGGITGTYDKVTGLPGVVRTQSNGDLGLLVQFANSAAYNPQVQRAITYVNNAMAASNAPAALFPALMALQDGNGAPVTTAFARITPEPYADAMEIGAETALSLAAAGRTMGLGEDRGGNHVFAFGQTLGSLRQFAGHETQGISRATINGYGVLGGLGFGGEGYALSAYVGWVDQNQSVGAIGASTSARGIVGGMALRLGGSNTSVTLSASYDAARATTRRNVPDAGQVSAGYTLPSFSLDASISHVFDLSQGWQLRPHLGATWVRTHHGALKEASAHPFALNIDEATRRQGFLDAGLGFENAPDAKGPWRSFLTLGMRYRLKSDAVSAIAGMAGGGYGLMAYGFGRDPVSATAAVGGEYRLSPGAVLFLNASGELGQSGKRESVTAGLRWRI